MGLHSNKGAFALVRNFYYLNHANDYGLTIEGRIGFDPKAVVARSRNVSAQLNNGVGFLLKKNKVDIIWGEATIKHPGEVLVNARRKPTRRPPNPMPKGALDAGRYRAKNIIIATGARPHVILGIEPDGKLVWTYFEAMVPEKFPSSLIVIGSGAIGIEFASLLLKFCRRFYPPRIRRSRHMPANTSKSRALKF